MPEELTENIIREPVEKYIPGKNLGSPIKEAEEISKPNKKNDIIFKGAFEDYFVYLLRFIYSISRSRPKQGRLSPSVYLTITSVCAISTGNR